MSMMTHISESIVDDEQSDLEEKLRTVQESNLMLIEEVERLETENEEYNVIVQRLTAEKAALKEAQEECVQQLADTDRRRSEELDEK